MKDCLQKIGALLGLFFGVLVGFGAGLCYLIQGGQYVPAIGVCILAGLAAPTIVKLWKLLAL